jgi:hypothetical protein
VILQRTVLELPRLLPLARGRDEDTMWMGREAILGRQKSTSSGRRQISIDRDEILPRSRVPRLAITFSPMDHTGGQKMSQITGQEVLAGTSVVRRRITRP